VGLYATTGASSSDAYAGETSGSASFEPFSYVGWDASHLGTPDRLFDQATAQLPVWRPLAAGVVTGGTHGALFCATRLPGWNFPMGTYDTSFGTGGQFCFSPYDASLGNGFGVGAATLWGNRLVLAGSADGDGDEDWVIVRLTNATIFQDDFETHDFRMWSQETGGVLIGAPAR